MSTAHQHVALMQLVVDGLSDPQSVSTDYAISLLPEVERAAFDQELRAVDEFYRIQRHDFLWHQSGQTQAMVELNGSTIHFIRENWVFAQKKIAESRRRVQIQRSAGLLEEYNKLSPAEQSSFIPIERADYWRDIPPFFKRWMVGMCQVYRFMSEADRFEPFEEKRRSMAGEWLAHAIHRLKSEGK